MENVKHNWFRLNKRTANAILIYYCLLIIVSAVCLFCIVVPEINPIKNISIFSFAIIGAIIAGVLGSGIFYSRKLYKACISLDMLEPMDSNDHIRQMGVVFYYTLRPLYAASLSVVTCIATKSGAEFITYKNNINDNFPFLIIVICFFVGYSAGDMIDYLEIKGKKIVEGVFKTDN